jgi:hypothetical protein
MQEDGSVCPLCDRALDGPTRDHIGEKHALLKAKLGKGPNLDDVRARVAAKVRALGPNRETIDLLTSGRAADLIRAVSPEAEKKVQGLFGKDHQSDFAAVQAAAEQAAACVEVLRQKKVAVDNAVQTCNKGLDERNEQTSHVETLGKALDAYVAAADEVARTLNTLAPSMVAPARLLQQEIDRLAGTSDQTLLIDLTERRPAIERTLRIRAVLEGLKQLKKHVDQALGETMEAVMSSDLTGSVMKWYGKIKTTGDPDVHFSGFAMEKTKAGDYKSRRLKVMANSYGVELASAVSSLSESKLNALGLCVSIASALRSPGPWLFFIIDDPIQSWDEEHETQFVGVIRDLVVEEGKQVVLLSHNRQWIKSVSLGCRSINGLHYEINKYTQDGPHLIKVEWTQIHERLREARTITNDPAATSVRLQQAEEEIRLACCQIAAEIGWHKLHRQTSPHNMNGKDVRAVLNEAGYSAAQVDKVSGMFPSADDAHHAPKHYEPNVERIRQHIATLEELYKSV